MDLEIERLNKKYKEVMEEYTLLRNSFVQSKTITTSSSTSKHKRALIPDNFLQDYQIFSNKSKEKKESNSKNSKKCNQAKTPKESPNYFKTIQQLKGTTQINDKTLVLSIYLLFI